MARSESSRSAESVSAAPTERSASGPGWLAGALSLGGPALLALAALGALDASVSWGVLALAVLAGLVLLAGVAQVTLCTRERPFLALGRFVSPSLAWLWLLAALGASLAFAAVAGGMAAGLIDSMMPAGDPWPLAGWLVVGILALGGLLLALLYRGERGVRRVESILKALVLLGVLWLVAAAVVASGGRDAPRSDNLGAWDFLANAGGFETGTDPSGEDLAAAAGEEARTLTQRRDALAAAFGAIAGLPVVWLWPHLLLARGWKREQRRRARLDLGFGLLLPLLLAAVALWVLAGPAGPGGVVTGWLLAGGVWILLLAGLSALAMGGGFLVAEVVDQYRSRRVFAVGAVGVALAAASGPWLGSTEVMLMLGAAAAVVLPLVHLGFWLLLNSRRGLGEDVPRGRVRVVWNLFLGLAWVIVTAVAVGWLLGEDPVVCWTGLSILLLFGGLTVGDFARRQRKTGKARPSLLG